MTPALTATDAAFFNCKKRLAAHRDVPGNAKRVSRRSGKDICRIDIQTFSDCRDICALYEGIKKEFGLNVTKTAALESTIGDTIMDHG